MAVPSEQTAEAEQASVPTETSTDAPASAESTPEPAEQAASAEEAPSTVDADQQLSLFSDEPEMNPAQAKVIEQLSHLNLMGMTPMDVMSRSTSGNKIIEVSLRGRSYMPKIHELASVRPTKSRQVKWLNLRPSSEIGGKCR